MDCDPIFEIQHAFIQSTWHHRDTHCRSKALVWCTFEQEFDDVGIVFAKLYLALAVKNRPPLTTRKRDDHSNAINEKI